MPIRRTDRRFCLPVLAALCFAAQPASAGDEPDAAEANAAFHEGTALVGKAQWAEALAAFERADKLKRHAVTTYNIGACERAMGRYTRARRTLAKAIEEHEASGGRQLSESLLTETKGYIKEIDGLLAKAAITVTPANASIAVDGRPLEPAHAEGDVATLVAGTRPPGPGEPPPKASFQVILDPGAHVFTFSRKGFNDAVVNRTFSPGAVSSLKLELDRLPATLHIASNRDAAIVTVNGADVGPVPVDVLRPAGSYKVLVKKSGFIPYEAQVAVQPGEEVKLRATLNEDKPSLTQRWWFWTAAGVVVAGAAVGTYFATRSEPEPTRAQIDGGSLGWKLKVP